MLSYMLSNDNSNNIYNIHAFLNKCSDNFLFINTIPYPNTPATTMMVLI